MAGRFPITVGSPMEASALTYASRRGLLGRRSPMLRLQGDERLIALMRSGHDRAFEVVFDRYHGRLLAFCRSMLRSEQDAEDVLQEVFANAHNAILADERRINVRPWLYRIARNRCLNHLRKPVAEGQDTMDVHPHENGTTTDERVQKREELRLLLGDVKTLPETQRTALLLREIDALSYEEIAQAMDTTIPSVKSLLVRARITLAESSEARLLTCDDVRLELAEAAEGLVKASGPVRAHVRGCDDCREFRSQLRSDRKALAALFPLGPIALLQQALIAKLGGGAAGGSVAASGAATGSAGGGAAAGGALGGAFGGSAAASGTAGLGVLGSAVAGKAAVGVATAALLTAGAVEVSERVSGPGAATPAPLTSPARTAGAEDVEARHVEARRGHTARDRRGRATAEAGAAEGTVETASLAGQAEVGPASADLAAGGIAAGDGAAGAEGAPKAGGRTDELEPLPAPVAVPGTQPGGGVVEELEDPELGGEAGGEPNAPATDSEDDGSAAGGDGDPSAGTETLDGTTAESDAVLEGGSGLGDPSSTAG